MSEPDSSPPAMTNIGGQPSSDPEQEPESSFDAPGVEFWAESWPFKEDTSVGPTPDPDPAPPPLPRRVPARPAVMPLPVPTDARYYTSWDAGAPLRAKIFVAALAVLTLVVGVRVWTTTGGGAEQVAIGTRSNYMLPSDMRPDSAVVRTRVLPSGDLEVVHWIWSTQPVSSLTLTTPRTSGLDPGSVSVSHLVVAVDGARYPARSPSSRRSGSRTLQFPAARAIYLKYRLSGAVQTSGPTGRALARITALDVTANNLHVRTTVTVVGARVLSLACTNGPPNAVAVPCGSSNAGSWSVHLTVADQHSRVMAQVDLHPVSSSSSFSGS